MKDTYKWLSVPIELLIAMGFAVYAIVAVRRQRSRNTHRHNERHEASQDPEKPPDLFTT